MRPFDLPCCLSSDERLYFQEHKRIRCNEGSVIQGHDLDPINVRPTEFTVKALEHKAIPQM